MSLRPRSTSTATDTGSVSKARAPLTWSSHAPPQVDVWDIDPERTFLAWVADPDAPEELSSGDDQGVGLPASWLLGMLCASRTPLPDSVGRQLGYRQPRSIGDAATDLLLAVNDPSGPRCRSFAAAKAHLRHLDARAHVFEGA